MTAPYQPAEFKTALDAAIWNDLTTTSMVVTKISVAVGRGWTIPDLVTWCTRGVPAAHGNGGIITHRLRSAADHDPPRKHVKKFAQPRPWCGDCSDEHARWAFSEPGEPARRCECWTKPERQK